MDKQDCIQLKKFLPDKVSVGKDVEKLEPLHTVGGNLKWCNTMENTMELSKKKIKNGTTMKVTQSCLTLCDPVDCS